MENWDDIRFFLGIVRFGSVRAAANSLGVNHSTVSRRVTHLEKRLGVRLFEKLPSGYEITPAGQEILDQAEGMEEQASTIERKIFGRDQSLSGRLRVALPTALATHLLMPDLTAFSRLYPDIALELATSYDTVNLTMRQADIAIRLIYDQHSPPEHLYGNRLSRLYRGVYLSRDLLEQLHRQSPAPSVKWIYKEEDGVIPSWALEHDISTHKEQYIVGDLETQFCATKQGLGLSILPCFMGDAEPGLVRAPQSMTTYYGELWMLTHGETRHTRRVRKFSDFIKDAIKPHESLLVGKQ